MLSQPYVRGRAEMLYKAKVLALLLHHTTRLEWSLKPRPEYIPNISSLATCSLRNIVTSFSDAVTIDQAPRAPQDLCEVCCRLNLKQALQTRSHVFKKLGSIDAVLSRKDCAFCRLVATSTRDQWTNRGYTVGNMHNGKTDAEHVGECSLFLNLMDEQRPYFRVQIPLPSSPLGAGPDDMIVARHIRILDSDARLVDLENPFQITAVQDQINISRVRKWLDVCEREHKGNCVHASHQPVSTEFRVIDAKERKIVPAPDPVRYIALSYVWGRVKMLQNTLGLYKKLEEPGVLDRYWNQIPVVVQDAIALVLDLGEQYLWVDALCIIQDDPASKHRQISRMADIYSNAWLTIVALAGQHSNNPLPGVNHSSSRRSSTQHIETVDGVRLTVESVKLDPHLLQSLTWGSRAWTYQEMMLSKRLLYVGHDVVRYECLQYNFREDVDSAALVELQAKTYDGPPEKVKIGLRHVPEYIQQFSARQLSFLSDIQNAFIGITTRIEELGGSPFIYGLPVSTLGRALFWRPYTKLSRREGFPSWSWMGWIGRITFGRPTGFGDMDSFVSRNTAKTEIEIEAKSDILQFLSSSARFSVSFARALLFEGSDRVSLIRVQPELRMLILDDDGHQCGVTEGFYPEGYLEKGMAEYEFVLIGRENREFDNRNYDELGCYVSITSASDVDEVLGRHDSEISWLPRGSVGPYDSTIYQDKDWDTLRVMLVAREGGLIKRLGTAYIHEDAWTQANPQKMLFQLA